MQANSRWAISVRIAAALLGGILITATSSRADNCSRAHASFRQAAAMTPRPEDTQTLLRQEQLYRQVIAACPEHAAAHNNLGDVYERLGWYAEAIDAYQTAIRLRNDAPYPYFGLGDVYFKSGNYAEAITWYDAGLARAPEDTASRERRRLAEAFLQRRLIPSKQIIQRLHRPQTRGPGEPIKITFGADAKLGLLPFDTGKSDIREEARQQLQEIGKALSSAALASYVFEISGHTDVRGSDAANLKLSLRRAEAVKRYLVRHLQIASRRLMAKGYGERRLAAHGSTAAAHALNRRVEIVRRDRAGPRASQPSNTSDQPQLSLDVGFLYQQGRTGALDYIRTDGNTVLQTGRNPYRIFFRPYQTCYVYLLQKDAADHWYVLFPQKQPAANQNPVQGEREYWVPGFDRGFPLDETRGNETLYLLASAWPLPELEAPGPKLSEKVLPITRGFQTRGISHIGKPQRDPPSEKLRNFGAVVTDHVEQLSGTGGFAQTITFVHQ